MSPTPHLPSFDLDARVADAVRAVRARCALEPAVGLTLGSGLGGAIDALEDAVVFSTAELPHWPPSTVPGHAGRLGLGRWRGVPVAALSGRNHRYEGYTLDQTTFGVRVMLALGARALILTNAVGATNPDYRAGDLMVGSGHLNAIGKRGGFTRDELAERRAGRRVAEPYSPALREALVAAAARAGVPLHRGVLSGGLGPTYETAAEVRMAARSGADVACMSTVHEVMVAAGLGAQVATLSCVTNLATGLASETLTHADVTEVANRVASSLRALLDEYFAERARG